MSSHRLSLSGSLLSAVCDSRDKAGTQKEKKNEGSTNQCESIAPDLVQMKVRCTAETTTWKGMVLQVVLTNRWYLPFFSPHWFFSVLLFACILFTTDCMRQNLPGYTGSPALPGWRINTCCHRKVYYIYQHCLKSVEEIRNRKWAVTRGEPDQYLPFCVRRSSKSAAIALQHDLQQASCACFSWGYKDPILFNGSVLAA